MEQEKDITTEPSIAEEKETPTPEINGDKSASEGEDSNAMEVIESETVVSSEENCETTDKEEISETCSEVTKESEVIVDSTTRKRRHSEASKDENNIGNEDGDSQEAVPKETIESESHEDTKEANKESSSDIDLPRIEGLGKGKRARIPNKRYSDIVISPSKLGKPTIVENGEKEKEKEKAKPPHSLAVERIDSDTSGASSPTPKRMKTVDVKNPNYLLPFKFGWKRELVWRSTKDSLGRKMGDIYYYNPEGKKLRSTREVAEVLDNKTLFIENFTFFKEPLGLNDPEKEIIRDAKIGGGGSDPVSLKKGLATKPKKPMSPKIPLPKVEIPKSPKPGTSKMSPAQADNEEETKPPKRTRGVVSKVTNTITNTKEVKTPKSSTIKAKVTKAKSEKKTPSIATKQATSTSEDEAPMAGKKTTLRKSGKLAQKPVTSETPTKPVTPKRRTLKINSVTNQTNDKSNESIFMENYLQNLSYGYNTLLYVFQYLKVQDLLRAGCVCTMWKDIASHPLLWRTVRMKNSQVHSFEGLANTLQRHGTVQLDLRKMLLANGDEIWPEFSSNIGKVETLRKIELCRCPASVVEKLAETNPKLEVVNAVTIRCEKMNLDGLTNWQNLRELRLKSTTGLTLETNIDSLKSLVNLKSLSLTSIRDLNTMKLDVIAELHNLEVLDLGECTDFPENFGKDILSKLAKLEKLRLEKGQGDCHTFEILEAVKDMQQLEQLELVNFDIKAGFDKALGACKNIKKLLIIPTYISQSATTNHMVLGGVLRLQKSLSHFVWGVTLELLRVTELFVDQCEEPEKKEKKEKKIVGNGDSIPVLKPVPLIIDDKSEIPPALDPPQVEILALPGLQKLLLQSLPTTRVKILKIPFHATWRQSITDAVN